MLAKSTRKEEAKTCQVIADFHIMHDPLSGVSSTSWDLNQVMLKSLMIPRIENSYFERHALLAFVQPLKTGGARDAR